MREASEEGGGKGSGDGGGEGAGQVGKDRNEQTAREGLKFAEMT